MENRRPTADIDVKPPLAPLDRCADRELTAGAPVERATATGLLRALHEPVSTEGRRPEGLPLVDFVALGTWLRRRG